MSVEECPFFRLHDVSMMALNLEVLAKLSPAYSIVEVIHFLSISLAVDPPRSAPIRSGHSIRDIPHSQEMLYGTGLNTGNRLHRHYRST